MRKIVAAINMSLGGFCDHTAGIPDEAIHQHYADLLNSSGAALYGRITYQLMEYWRTVLNNPSGIKATDEFAVAIDKIPKIVFSRTLHAVDWPTARLADQDISSEVHALKRQSGGDILACSPGMIVSLTKLNLIDEYQICIHPLVAGSGLPLFKSIDKEIRLRLIKTKTFNSGAVILFYEPTKNATGTQP